jgi:predicted Rossmann fold flavoprotein
MEHDWDVIVIGGGAAGMMAAGRAAELGARVLLVEKNDILGKKLLITGGGRCNVTNAEPDKRKLLARFKDSDKFLFSPFSEFDNMSALQFFNSRGMPTHVEAEQRVFPNTSKAESVWNVLVEYMRQGGVTVRSNSPVQSIEAAGGAITGVTLKGGATLRARSYVLATGGKSRPETGSTGDGFAWLSAIGHAVRQPEASLVPITIKDQWVKTLSGKSLTDAKITIFQNEQKQAVQKGKILFTHFGLSGPAILNLSKDIGELLKYGEVIISLDILPTQDYSQLNDALQELFRTEDKKKFKNALSSLVPPGFASIIVEKSGIDPEKKCNSVSREERLSMVKLLKDIRMEASGLLGEDKAIVTSGGVTLEEVDFKTMASKLFPNLYLIGDILDIDRPSGGYSLQLCWTTGFVAGTNAAHTSAISPNLKYHRS